MAAAEIYVSDDGLLVFVDEAGAVLWAGPELPSEPVAREAKPPVPVRAPIDLGEYDEFENLVVRTDHSDEAAWVEVVELLARPWSTDEPSVNFLVVDTFGMVPRRRRCWPHSRPTRRPRWSCSLTRSR